MNDFTAGAVAMRAMPIGCTASRASENSRCMPSVSLKTHSTIRCRRAARQPELEAAAEGVPEQAHLLDADVVERELQAVERVLERPPLRQREHVGDDDARPVGEQARHGRYVAGFMP